MATTDATRAASTMSTEAYEKLGCFSEGIDDLVYEVAEDVAQKRNPGVSPVQIELQDVETAGDMVLNAFRELIRNGRLPSSASDSVTDMEACFRNEGE